MKLYIHSDTTKKSNLKYRIDVIMLLDVVSKSNKVAASANKQDLSMFPAELLDKTIDEFASLVDSIRLLIKSRGFQEVDAPHNSPDSDSKYYLFCLENSYVKCEVEVFCYLRVSDHSLKQRYKNRSAEEVQQNWADNHIPKVVRQYNTEIDNLVFEYNYKKSVAELNGEDFDDPIPPDIAVSVKYIQINDVKTKTQGQALGEVAEVLQQISFDMMDETKRLRKLRTEWIKKQKQNKSDNED